MYKNRFKVIGNIVHHQTDERLKLKCVGLGDVFLEQESGLLHLHAGVKSNIYQKLLQQHVILLFVHPLISQQFSCRETEWVRKFLEALK